jgi:RNA polymerase sigma-54 factor
MLKQLIDVNTGTQLAMTPRMQLAIRLLQLSRTELSKELLTQLEQNPLLEEVEATASEEEDDEADTEITLQNLREPPSAPIANSHSMESDIGELLEKQPARPQTLREHLLEQLQLCPIGEMDRAIGTAIIESIDDDGYLREPLDFIHGQLGLAPDPELKEVTAVLHLIQQFDPAGIAARDLGECLALQLRQLPPAIPCRQSALRLVENHLQALASGRMTSLRKKLGLDEAGLQGALQLIQSLNPKPGTQLGAAATGYITPDVLVTHTPSGQWKVSLNGEGLPKLTVNGYYAALSRNCNKRDAAYMRNQLQEARWFIKSLDKRHQTLLRVATAIVEHQQEFLLYGEQYMKPMIQQELADELEMHESTISRVTTGKYMSTPRGNYELKYFFSTGLGNRYGNPCSATAVRATIRRLIASEPSDKPFSDAYLALQLQAQGVNIARRTVSKYREELRIPSCSVRKRTGFPASHRKPKTEPLRPDTEQNGLFRN